jgi:hypothetical protein
MIDTLLFMCLCLYAIDLSVRKLKSRAAILILSFLALLLFFVLYDRRRQERMKRKRLNMIRTKLLREKLWSYDDGAIKSHIENKDAVIIRNPNPQRWELFSALCVHPATLVYLGNDPMVRETANRFDPNIEVIDAEELLQKCGIECTEEEAQKHLAERLTSQESRRSVKAVIHAKWNRYFLLGILLLVVSFFTKYKIYYRMLASFCLFLTVAKGFFQIQKETNYFRFFLDNMDM